MTARTLRRVWLSIPVLLVLILVLSAAGAPVAIGGPLLVAFAASIPTALVCTVVRARAVHRRNSDLTQRFGDQR